MMYRFFPVVPVGWLGYPTVCCWTGIQMHAGFCNTVRLVPAIVKKTAFKKMLRIFLELKHPTDPCCDQKGFPRPEDSGSWNGTRWLCTGSGSQKKFQTPVFHEFLSAAKKS
jgi:hypothetical protein